MLQDSWGQCQPFTQGTCGSPKLLFFKSSLQVPVIYYSSVFAYVLPWTEVSNVFFCFPVLISEPLVVACSHHSSIFFWFPLGNVCRFLTFVPHLPESSKAKKSFNVFQPHLPPFSINYSLLCLSHPTVSFNDPCVLYALGKFSHDFS